ncbi:MAG: heterocyst frequency control protein PatD [Mojavia pulchra JT2-VF2]|jgi:glycine cleavage system regulatory protein|uniref:Heterocyst frequency control protein PatD n=1 Tax=Mojavia pulchra JT2-VF2 TaxID=287848 RepID=A0A951UFR4_9NOST|nr:heterocyst frequency control protein PatD [Mojavia pulchra JT2-VF2]
MSLNQEKYQALANLLEQLRSDATNTQLDATELRQRLASLHQFFQRQIVPLADVDSREQSYRTEISKQLRLLEIDVMFFQGARQASTVQARLQTICDRLTTLMQYCDAILQLQEPKDK